MTPPIRALALETTSRRAQVALVQNGTIVGQASFEAGLKHTAHLLPLIEQLFRGHCWSPSQIQEIYVSVGPGGFTGTRIGVTLAKALALARAGWIVAVPTARVLVENAPREANDALVVIDARRGKAWTQRFTRDGRRWQQAGEPVVCTLGQALDAAPRPVWLVGEGVAYHAQGVDPWEAGVHVCQDSQPRISVVAALGWELARAGAFSDSFALAPMYVRRPEAEEKRLGLD